MHWNCHQCTLIPTDSNMTGVETIDAVTILSNWYGPDSIACQSVRILSDQEAETEFTVGQNLCGPQTEPPMFDRLSFLNGVFTTETSIEDAKEHFIKEVGVSVVPGHNIMGLVARGLEIAFYNKEATLYVTGFDFMRFTNLLLPDQQIRFSGEVDKLGAAALATLVMTLQRRPFTRNFCVEAGDPINEAIKQKLLAQHWLFESNAQGLGMTALTSTPAGVVPVLMEVGRSRFYKAPVLAGDVLRNCFINVFTDKQQVSGDVKTYVGDKLIAEQENLLLQLVPIEEIKKKIQGAQIL